VGLMESWDMTMSVLKRGNSKNWYIQFQLKGKTYIRSSRTMDKKAAEQMERDRRRQLHSQEFLGHKERITIRDALQASVPLFTTDTPSVSPSSTANCAPGLLATQWPGHIPPHPANEQ